MLNVTQILTSLVAQRATADHAVLYAGDTSAPLDLVQRAAALALPAIGRSDALYHNVEHTAHVTMVGLEILKAKQQSEASLSSRDWANVVIALLCHDIGYVRELCRDDVGTRVTSGSQAGEVQDVSGSSDAALMPVHVNRGKRFVEETFSAEPLADIGLINACIERTRFPVPEEPWYASTDDLPGLVRAADLIGQLSDPRYLQKLSAIFFEFEETGFNRKTGYKRPGDLLTAYPLFFENNVTPYIGAAVEYLKRNQDGREILAHLYGNLERAAMLAPSDPLRTAAGR